MIQIKNDEQFEMRVNRFTGEKAPYYCVSVFKLALLSFTTLGIYELFWFYKNWKTVKITTKREINPFWRAVFSPLFCYSFANTVNSTAESLPSIPRISPTPIAVSYFIFIVLHRLPDPYWLISFFSFLPLIPIANQIRQIHEAVRPGEDTMYKWGFASILSLIIGSLFTFLVIVASFGPPSYILNETEIPDKYKEELTEAGLIEPGERMLFFYSSGLWSILDEGNIATDKRLVSYETIDNEIYYGAAAYNEIHDIDVAYSNDLWGDTIVTVKTLDNEEFLLVVSNEKGRDKSLVSTIRELMVPPQ